MTNTPNGTWEEMVLHFYNSRTESVGGLNIWFDKDPSKEPYFKISWCDIWTERHFRNLPTATEKIWRIEKTSSTMKIHCNDVEVAEVYKSECEDSFADEFWRKDIDWVWFLNGDRASDYYRPYQPGISNTNKIGEAVPAFQNVTSSDISKLKKKKEKKIFGKRQFSN